MKKTLVFTLSLLTLSISLLAQDATTTTTTPTAPAPVAKSHARPNIPGTFVLEFGLNRLASPMAKFDLSFFGSRSLNIYYQYDMRILKSKFSFHPGIGFGLDRYRFKATKGLVYSPTYDENGVVTMQAHSPALKKSQLMANYLDIPLELRFSTNPEDPARSFKVSIGVRGGYLFNSHTKIKYKEDGDKVKEKVNRNFNLNQFRYGVFAKFGGGNFSFFCHYNLSPLFKSGQAPEQTVGIKDMNNFTIGISLTSF